jgi:CheY-like chemotaxis protein
MKPTILFVDDSRMMRMANHRALSRAGYEVIEAEDGQCALSLAQEHLPQLIVLDMMLPKISGHDVLRALKGDARTNAIPVIVLTSLSQKNKERLAIDGAADFVEKSDELLRNDSALLVAAVQKVLHAATT